MSLKTKLVANVVVGCGAVLAMFGCGSSGGAGENTGAQSMRLQGSIPSSVRLLDNARVRAIGSDGKHYWTYVDAAGHFVLTVKPGVSYRVLVTNAQRVGPDRVTGHLVVAAPTGASKWIGIHSGGTIDLGVLSTSGAAASIHTKSEGDVATAGTPDDAASSSDAKGSDDAETHEDDTDESGSACTDHDGKDDPTTTEDDDDIDLKPAHDPGEQVHDDLEAEHEDGKDDPGEKDDDQSCAAGGGGAGAGGGTPAPSATTPAPGAPAPGTAQLGGACHVSADCAGALICAASVCSAAVIR